MSAKPESLLARTYRLLEQAKAESPEIVSYPEIAKGAGVNENWVAKFVQRNIAEPGVTKVQRVHDFLVSRIAREHIAPGCDPNASQHMGGLGNG